MEKYCELIKKGLDKKAFKRKEIIDELFIAKKEWNYPKIKSLEIQEKLMDNEIYQIMLIYNLMNKECPINTCERNKHCENKCKGYYDFLLEGNKI